MGGCVGDDARQVRGAAVRRSTHTPGRTDGVGQHVGALAAGQRADNTDIDGVMGALGTASGSCDGGIWRHRSAVVAGLLSLARNGSRSWLAIMARRCHLWISPPGAVSQPAAGRTSTAELPRVIAGVDVVVSVPADAVAPYAPVLAATPLLLDDLRSVADTAVGRRSGRRPGDQWPADAAASGVRTGRTVHRAAGAQRSDEGGAFLTLASVHGGGGGVSVCWRGWRR